MRKLLRSLVVLGAAAVAVAVTSPAAWARPTATRYDPTAGYDVSYPQCSSQLPSGQAFGIVGVNGGLATTANSCLDAQLRWAWQSTGAVASQRPAQLYLNTANPGQVKDQVTTWPTSGTAPAYGNCDGSNSAACSWVYGWQRAKFTVESIFAPAAGRAGVPSAAANYTWWLDVETQNTWQTGSSTAQSYNRATLEGMTAYLQQAGAPTIGLYSTAYQWNQIAGTVPTTSPLAGLDSWLAGATSQNGAKNNCARPALVPNGVVTLAQYVSGGLDHDLACR